MYAMQTGYPNKCNLPCANDEYQQPLINAKTSGTRPVLADLTVIPLQMCACTGTRHQHIGQWLIPDARPYYKGHPAGIRAHPNAWPGFIKRPSKTAHVKVVGLSHGQPMLLPPALLKSSFDHHLTPCSPPLPPPLPCSFPPPHQLARPHITFSLPRYPLPQISKDGLPLSLQPRPSNGIPLPFPRNLSGGVYVRHTPEQQGCILNTT